MTSKYRQFGNRGGLWEDRFLETEKVTMFMPLALEGPQKDHPRLTREYFIVTRMIELYCKHHHQHPTLCNDCLSLLAFSKCRLERCIYGGEKPTCANCNVHCYKPDQRQQIREVMKWAGPRLLLKHPILTIQHFIDDRKEYTKVFKKL